VSESEPFARLGPTPQSYRVETYPTAPATYITIVLRNQRILEAPSDVPGETMVQREFITGDEWENVCDALLDALHDVDGVSFRFIGDGVDPAGTAPDDDEALEEGTSLAVVLSVEGELETQLRHVVSDFLARYDLFVAWFHVGRDTADAEGSSVYRA